MPNTSHKLIVIHSEISDWLKKYKDFDSWTTKDVRLNVENAFTFSFISDRDKEEITNLLVELFKVVKR